MSEFIDILSPSEQEGAKVVVRAWLKRPGEQVRMNDPIVELETDKVAVEVAAPADGVLEDVALEAGAEAPPGAVLGRVRTGAARADDFPAQQMREQSRRKSIADFDPRLRLSPLARRIAVENDLDPRFIEGTGRGGRITHEDVTRALAQREAQLDVSSMPAPKQEIVTLSSPPAPDGKSRLLPHDSMRLAIAEHMTRSLATAPHVTSVFETDFSAVQAHRMAHKQAFAELGVGLTYTAYIVLACVEAMKAAPEVNSRWRDDCLEIFDDVNIGIATALENKGLIVPVIHQAQTLSLQGVAAKLQELTEKARASKLAPADVRGGTFSISNHGVSGSLVAAPIIINQPQSAILGVGKLEKRVVVREVGGADSIQIRPMAFVSLTIDHRVIDGRQTNAWLTRFVDVIENWI